MIRGVRGATTVKANDADEMIVFTKQLFEEMIENNNIAPEDVAQVIITVTDDLNAAFPARALRMIDGWSYVPVMCMKEIAVPNAVAKCIRVMMTIETSLSQKEIKHSYLGEAVSLRPDLASETKI